MRAIYLFVIFTFVSCVPFNIKKDNLLFSKKFKIYHYTSNLSSSEFDICEEVLDSILKIFASDISIIDNMKSNCTLYVDIKSKKKVKDNNFRYTIFIDFENIYKELDEKKAINKALPALSVTADENLREKLSEITKDHNKNILFVEEKKKDLANGMMLLNSNESVLETSVTKIYGITLTVNILKGSKLIDSFVTSGYGEKEEAVKSALLELVSKIQLDKLKMEYIVVEFSNIKTSQDFNDIYSFLSKNFISFEVLSIKQDSLIIKLPMTKSLEELSSHMIATMKNSAVENIDFENKKITITLNYTLVGIL
ncbi:MAG: hypothetical protein N2Z20_02685 [Elusimicrobiales bacterium]|nr:hypothetical protein [Elusimicrobiales bacterium]